MLHQLAARVAWETRLSHDGRERFLSLGIHLGSHPFAGCPLNQRALRHLTVNRGRCLAAGILFSPE